MKIDEALEEVEVAKRKAHAAATCFGVAAHTIVDSARQVVLEAMMAAMMAERSQYVETFPVKVALELRDFWDLVAEEIAK